MFVVLFVKINVPRKILYLALRGNKYTDWRKLHNEDFTNLGPSNGYVKGINSRRMRAV
jgi:hypothetical protein